MVQIFILVKYNDFYYYHYRIIGVTDFLINTSNKPVEQNRESCLLVVGAHSSRRT